MCSVAITNVNKPITVISREYKLQFKTSFVPSENMISFINNKRQHISHNLENNMISLSPSRVVMILRTFFRHSWDILRTFLGRFIACLFVECVSCLVLSVLATID
ncbi:Hypothetical predicted protein, partial [Mytilus galloprovincialis]